MWWNCVWEEGGGLIVPEPQNDAPGPAPGPEHPSLPLLAGVRPESLSLPPHLPPSSFTTPRLVGMLPKLGLALNLEHSSGI